MTELEQFDIARKLYYGTKRGTEVEFQDFKRKHKKKWQEFLPLLLPAIQIQIKVRKIMKERGEFVPPPKNFKTWIGNYCWQEEYPQADKEPRQKQAVAVAYKDGILLPKPANHEQISNVFKKVAESGNKFMQKFLEKRK